jgi:dynactin complex subunit
MKTTQEQRDSARQQVVTCNMVDNLGDIAIEILDDADRLAELEQLTRESCGICAAPLLSCDHLHQKWASLHGRVEIAEGARKEAEDALFLAQEQLRMCQEESTKAAAQHEAVEQEARRIDDENGALKEKLKESRGEVERLTNELAVVRGVSDMPEWNRCDVCGVRPSAIGGFCAECDTIQYAIKNGTTKELKFLMQNRRKARAALGDRK